MPRWKVRDLLCFFRKPVFYFSIKDESLSTDDYNLVTFLACWPLGPFSISNSTD